MKPAALQFREEGATAGLQLTAEEAAADLKLIAEEEKAIEAALRRYQTATLRSCMNSELFEQLRSIINRIAELVYDADIPCDGDEAVERSLTARALLNGARGERRAHIETALDRAANTLQVLMRRHRQATVIDYSQFSVEELAALNSIYERRDSEISREHHRPT